MYSVNTSIVGTQDPVIGGEELINQMALHPLIIGMYQPSTLKAISLLRKYGTNAHVYLPGAGVLNGLQAANFLDSALTTPGTLDNPVGGVVDGFGAINATQSTTPAKPMLRRGAVCLNQYSKDRTNGAWGGSGFTANSATRVTLPSGAYQAASGVSVPGATYTVAAILSGVPGTTVSLYAQDGGGAFGSSGTSISLTATPTLYVFTRVAVEVVMLGGLRWDSGATVVVDVAAQALFQGTLTAAQIQALGGIPLTTPAPASTALGPYYWQFDGVDDSLALSGPLFQVADDQCVVAAVKYGSSGSGCVVAPSSNTATYAKQSALGQAAGSCFVRWSSDTTDYTTVPAYPYTTGQSYVVSGRKVGTGGIHRVNGVQAGSVSLAAMVTSTVNAGYIGLEGNGAGNFTGSIYPVIAIKGTVTDADLLTLERLVASMSGVTL